MFCSTALKLYVRACDCVNLQFCFDFQQLNIDEKPWHKRTSASESQPAPGARKAPFRGTGGGFKKTEYCFMLNCRFQINS